ncbi:unnamed protein product [Effrenium voratum]|uniref:Uncharacterized protein n=1 Tax=Effrenium voratum TaxID=2562239 RepID=A0AA36MJH3_9DINO|nr:unnamed protein product [Effrenium voratum]CAJ1416993.1 unnamed protein product [Effrenium voratum]
MAEGEELSYSKWLNESERRLHVAKAMTRDLLASLRENKLQEALNPDAGLDQVVREQKQKKERVYTQCRQHQNVIDASYSCIQDLKRAAKRTVDSITQLTHEKYKGTANFQVCELRQELRAKRPPSELFKDILDEALEQERQLLLSQRDSLLALEAEGKAIIDEIEEKQILLTRNSGERRVNMHHDISSLNQKVSMQIKQPEEAATPKSKLREESKQTLEDTYKLLARYNEHRRKTQESVEEFRARRENAKARTEANLTKRVQQLSERKLELDTQLRDLITSITKAERELESSFRKLSPNDAAKKEKLESDKDLLERLRRLKDQVAEDTRHKSAALEIDNTCKRVNAAKAGEAKLKKEMPPVRSRSCVNFRSNGDKDRPGSSPASPGACSPGGSRSLKAGAAVAFQ